MIGLEREIFYLPQEATISTELAANLFRATQTEEKLRRDNIQTKQKNTILRELLKDFAKPELDLKPSKVGTLDIIGNAYEYLIKNFAASGGQKAGEFYTPPEVCKSMVKINKSILEKTPLLLPR